MEALTRTLMEALRKRIGRAVETSEPIFAWLARHAGWLITRYRLRPDGRTSYQLLHRENYRGEVLALGEELKHKWDVVLAWPPCTHQTISDARTQPDKLGDGRLWWGMAFVIRCLCMCSTSSQCLSSWRAILSNSESDIIFNPSS